MGCRLPKPRDSDEAPGKIYSTLRKAQVETHTGVAYTYHFLDFLLGNEAPVKVCELYQQGFILAAVHPFVHSCGPARANLQRQLHRAVLIRETNSFSENGVLKCVPPRLETDVCFSGLQAPDPEVIQEYVKKVQDLADSGVLFVGFLQQPGGGPCFLGHGDPEELSSLHSSPSPIHQHTQAPTLSPTSDHHNQIKHIIHFKNEGLQKQSYPNKVYPPQDFGSEANQQQEQESCPCQNHHKSLSTEHPSSNSEDGSQHIQTEAQTDRNRTDKSRSSSTEPNLAKENCLHQNSSRSQKPKEPENREQVKNHDKLGKLPETFHALNRVQVFALYNHTVVLSGSPRFFSVRIPLQVHKDTGLITTVGTHWLDYMTQHFRSGAQLIDGYFHLGDNTESSSTLESVFIFQSASDDIMTATTYDAIVVEQWTIIDGVAVKTDYVPLLQSLAQYGWRLMCVLSTPIVKTNSDGSLATKQILFLQRPVLPRKTRDFTRLHLKGRNKRNLNSNEAVRRKILSAASLAENEGMVKECESRTKDEETKNVQSVIESLHRNGTDAKTLQVVQNRDVDVEQQLQVSSKTTNADAKGKVKCGSEEKEVRPPVPERALFSGVC
ncbi:hypothetical protein NFI96_015603 [Prochilodus magdalenae]|nr:hypothetical protein NFI96_015603 [Prochilodus magdalenae]